MRIPGVVCAVIDAAKLRDYLLSPSHPIGRFKARFFAGLGYTQDEWELLARDLRQHAESGNVVEGDRSAHGQKLEVRGRHSSPTGRATEVIAVWIVRTGEDFPRFATAFPK